MTIKPYLPQIKMFFLPSLTLMIIVLSSYFAGNTSSQGPTMKLGNKGNSQNTPIQLQNRTTAFDVAKAEVNNGRVRLTLKNNYNKTIAAYAISTGGGSHNLRELGSEELITPGSTRYHELRVRSEANITILAVVFEDRTSDGDPTAAKEINDYRLGKKIQYDRIVPILNRVLSARENEMQLALSEAQSGVQALSSGSAKKPHFIIAGLRDAKEAILMDIEELKQLAQSGDPDLVRGRITRITRSLQRY